VRERLVDAEVVVLPAEHGAGWPRDAAAGHDLHQFAVDQALAAARLVDGGDAERCHGGGAHSSSRISGVRR
jgi:hypothetical protein